MTIWGKILGGAAGFALGGPLGALLGAVAGHAVDRFTDAPIAAPTEDDERAAMRQIAFTIGVIVLGAKMAKADGIVSRSEVAAFKQVFTVPPEEEGNVGRIFDQARRDARGFEPYAEQISRLFRRKSRVLEGLIDALFHIAKADGEVGSAEIDYLRRVAEIFGFDQADFARLRESHLGLDAADPYNILGVTREMDNAAIKAAHRRIVRDSHPDRLIAKGMPAEAVALATARLATVNAAYDRIRKERGFA
jgi:DnaJ like chaperone protein